MSSLKAHREFAAARDAASHGGGPPAPFVPAQRSDLEGWPTLRISVRPGRARDVIALTGEIDVATAPDLSVTVHRLLSEGRLHLLGDLDAVTYLDGAAIRALVTATHDVARAGGSLWLTPHPLCLRLLTITGETHRLNIAGAAEAAVTGAAATGQRCRSERQVHDVEADVPVSG